MEAALSTGPAAHASPRMEQVTYDDRIVRWFVYATMVWGAVGMLVGLIIALQIAWWPANVHEVLTFGRLRPLHTNAVIFAFAGNAIFAAIYYSSQRLLKTRMFSDILSQAHFWGWQGIIVSAAITLPLGYSQSKEYAELEWPIDIAIAVVWVVFAINFFGAIARRREKHLYVAIWFYIATIITVAVLHIFNSLVIPAGVLKSYSVYAGVQDALVQWWYGHNAVAFFLTTPFLGLMYYFPPKAANRPVFSYKLSIIHFGSLVFIYIWAGPHHLHYTALPEWASTLGMVFSVMLWMPSWGGMLNGLLTLRGAWGKLRDDAVLKFFVVGITFYGMSTFEGPMLSVKSVNALSHYTDWTIAHVHSGALGWNGFMTFGMVYWLVPKLWKTEMWSKKLANAHFWLGTIGIIVYVMAMYSAGVAQGLMWRAFDETGRLAYPDFVETVAELIPMYWVRVVGGTLYLAGTLLGVLNLVMSVVKSKAKLSDETVSVTAREVVMGGAEAIPLPRGGVKYDDVLNKVHAQSHGNIHRMLEGWGGVFTVLVLVGILVGSIAEIVPMILVKSNIPTIASVQPYTPLELEGRDLYIREGCNNCHSQMIRPMRHEVERYGEYGKPGEYVYEHPFLWGSKRTGPDLAREGVGKLRKSHTWHVRHFENPRAVNEKSIMPAYGWLLERDLDMSHTQQKLRAMITLGVPYTEAQVESAVSDAEKQSASIAAEIEAEGGPAGLANKEVVAMIAYLQRLGVDLDREMKLGAEASAQSEVAP